MCGIKPVSVGKEILNTGTKHENHINVLKVLLIKNN